MITFTPPHTQAYHQAAPSLWRAQLAIGGAQIGDAIEAASEPALRALVVERLRAWSATAGADDLGELLEQAGQPRGARVTATRRVAVEALLTSWEVTP